MSIRIRLSVLADLTENCTIHHSLQKENALVSKGGKNLSVARGPKCATLYVHEGKGEERKSLYPPTALDTKSSWEEPACESERELREREQ